MKFLIKHKFMRRIFTIVMLLVSMMFFTGCRHNDVTDIENVETIDYVYRTKFEGHSYILFKQNGSTNMHNITGVVHDPDCECFNK